MEPYFCLNCGKVGYLTVHGCCCSCESVAVVPAGLPNMGDGWMSVDIADKLAPARGVALAIVLSTVAWALAVAIYWLVLA